MSLVDIWEMPKRAHLVSWCAEEISQCSCSGERGRREVEDEVREVIMGQRVGGSIGHYEDINFYSE